MSNSISGKSPAWDHYGQAFRRLRERAEIKPTTLSRETGVSRATIKNGEDGAKDWRVPTLLKLLEGIGATLADLHEEIERKPWDPLVLPEGMEPPPEMRPSAGEVTAEEFFSLENPAVRAGARGILDLMFRGNPQNEQALRIQARLDELDARVSSIEQSDPDQDEPNGTNGDH